jgi:hypothetical protein
VANAESVTFIAAVAKVQTLADGGLRVTLDLPEDAIVEVAWLMVLKREGVALRLTGTRANPGGANDPPGDD